MSGRAWTHRRLTEVAAVLSRISSQPIDQRRLERLLRHALGLKSVTIEEPKLDALDPGQWGITETTRGLLERGGLLSWTVCNNASSVETQIRYVESALSEELGRALYSFCRSTNSIVRTAASIDGRINVALYNYLVYEGFQKFRLQFASTFPGLVHTTLTTTSGSLGTELRTIVDQGAPLVKSLAARWGVRPGVVRHLIGKPSGQFGAHWASNIKALAALLNALRPEDLPGDDPDAWRQFNKAVEVGQNLFHKPVWKSETALSWLRECTNHIRAGSCKIQSRWLPNQNALKRIGRFRIILIEALRYDIGITTVNAAQDLCKALEGTVDDLFYRVDDCGLENIASRFEEGLIRLREEQTRVSNVTMGTEMWPLIPAHFISSDGTRMMRPLTTLIELEEHGTALRNCLGKGYAGRYIRKGSNGLTFIIGVYETEIGAPCSTAEFILKYRQGMLTHELSVVQHTARENTKPSAPCAKAVDELIHYCYSGNVRRHLEKGWRLIAKRNRPHPRCDQVEINSEIKTALKQALGVHIYEEMLAKTSNHQA